MGYTEYRATEFYKGGQINVKKEIDNYINSENDYYRNTVKKSKIVKGVYYGLVEGTDKTINQTIHYAAVALFYTERNTYIGVKLMEDSMGPCYYDCPKNILDALSETQNAYAKQWREKCREAGKTPLPTALPIGSTIEFEMNGKNWKFTKEEPNRYHKRPYWKSGPYYIPQNRIPRSFTVVSTPI